MARQNIAPSTEGATSKEVIEKEVAAAEVVETAKEETADVVETEKEETPVNGEFEVNGRKYTFSDRCPAKLQFNDTVYTREELLTNEDVLESLVIGESPFVKKV